ncbi:glycosyltransferase 87 family protein [Rothia nasisuis]|uniref:glycosyltransferase 87 family protein n=1 Tax=Rothia nasisuis TaxID=2109647 RepID=UPI001F003517|nr:glycosyltransferase 87 family protein [Rothia nasisuis]
MSTAPTATTRPAFVALTQALTGNAALAAAGALTLISLYPFLWDDKMVPREFFDLQVYYGGVEHWLDTGQLYNWALPPEEIYGFTYPPFAALVFAPFVLLTSAETAGPIFLVLNVAALVTLVYLSCRGMGVTGRPALAAGLWLTPLLLTFFPIRFNMELGQINLFLVLLILSDVIYLKNTRWHGVLIALTACIKLTPAIFGLFFLATRDWKSLTRFIGTGLASIVLSFAVDFEVAREYFTQKIFESSRIGSVTGALNYNLLGTWSMLFPAWLTGLLFTLTALAALVLAYRAVRVLAHQDAGGGYLGAASCVAVLGLLLSPISWTHHWVWFVTLLIFSALYGWRSARAEYLFLAAAGTLIFSLPFAVWFGGYDWGGNEWPELLALLHALPVVWAAAYLWFGAKRHPASPLPA